MRWKLFGFGFVFVLLAFSVSSATRLDHDGMRYIFESVEDGDIVVAESFGVTSGDAESYVYGTEIVYQANSFSTLYDRLICGENVNYHVYVKDHETFVEKLEGTSLRIMDPMGYLNEDETEVSPVLEYALDVLWEFLMEAAQMPFPSIFGLIFDDGLDISRTPESARIEYGDDWELIGFDWNWYIHKKRNGKPGDGKFKIDVIDNALLDVIVQSRLGDCKDYDQVSGNREFFSDFERKKLKISKIIKRKGLKEVYLALIESEDDSRNYGFTHPIELVLDANFEIREEGADEI